VAVAVLVLVSALAHPGGAAAAAPSGSLPALPIGLGFSEGSVVPLASGIPVYAAGDQLWFKAYAPGPVNVTVFRPLTGGVGTGMAIDGIGGNTSVSLLSFAETDPAGVWTLDASAAGESASVQFHLLDDGAPAPLSGYAVGAGGVLGLTYSTPSQSAYGLSACTGGTLPQGSAGFSIPTSLGGGALSVGLDGDQVAVTTSQGSSSAAFRFWVSLSQDYSYVLAGGSTVETRTMVVAETAPVGLTPGQNGSFSTSLQEEMPMRAGEFTLGANFQGAQGVTVVDDRVLVTGTGSWVWLRGCAGGAGGLAESVTVTSPLSAASASSWPRYAYLLYDELGVGLFTVEPVSVQPAAVQLVAAGWGGAALTDGQVEVGGAESYAVGNGTVYLVADHYPLRVSVGAIQGAQQEVQVEQPFSVTRVNVSADQVVVRTVSGGAPVSGGVVTLGDANGTVAVGTSSGGGEAVFYVPPGEFSVAGVYQGRAAASSFSTGGGTAGGRSVQLTLQFGGGGGGGAGETTLEYLLLLALAAGVAMNAWVWSRAYRRKETSATAGAPPPSSQAKEGALGGWMDGRTDGPVTGQSGLLDVPRTHSQP